MIGKTISHYKILEKLGEGGMGVVYKAQDTRLRRFVALKFLPPHLSSDEDTKRRFIHEAEAASALDHPNIGTIYEIDETSDGRMFIAMAYYEGQTLQQKLAKGPARIDEAIDTVSQIASGLAKAHQNNILHRDIKPANIMLTTDGHAKIVDFGLAKLAGRTRVTRTGSTVGTVSYMSPEQVRGEDVDSRSDVFSAGVVLYELLTGQLPFRGDYEPSVMYLIMNEDPEPLATYREDLPEGAQSIVDKALAKDSEDRYSSASDLLEDLRTLQEGRQVAALERRASKKAGRRTGLYSALAIAVIVAGYAVVSHFVLAPEPESSYSGGSVSEATVAVLPLAVRGSSDSEGLGEGIAGLLSTRLDGAGDLGSVDAKLVSSYLGQGNRVPDQMLGREVAENFNAGLYLLGDVMRVGSALDVHAAIYDARLAGEAIAEANVKGNAEQTLSLVDDLASELLIDRLRRRNDFRFDIESVTTKSFPALKAFLAGEHRFRYGPDGLNPSNFQRAVEADSTFALAWYRLADVLWWPMQDLEQTRYAISRAYLYSGDLPRRDRLRIRAFREDLFENDLEAERLYRTLVANFPDDVEGWDAFGIWQATSAPRRGRPHSESREAFERALSLDADEWQALFHLTSQSQFEGKYDQVEALLQRRFPDGEIPLMFRADLAFKVGDARERERILDELARADDWDLHASVVSVVNNTQDPASAMDAARVLAESERSDEVRGFGHIVMGYLEAARGRWQAAKSELDAAEDLNPALALEYRALLATAPFLSVPHEELSAIRREIEEWDAESIAPSDNPAPWLRVHDDAHPYLRVYLLGLLSARMENYEAALQQALELDQVEGPSHITRLMRDLSHGLRARIALGEGRLEEALAEFQQAELRSPPSYALYSPIYKEQRERYLRAEILHELGRDEEALGWTSSFGGSWHIDMTYSAPLCLRRAEYYEESGQPEMAAEQYSKFVNFWKDCDESLRPQVDKVRAKLVALTASEK